MDASIALVARFGGNDKIGDLPVYASLRPSMFKAGCFNFALRNINLALYFKSIIGKNNVAIEALFAPRPC